MLGKHTFVYIITALLVTAMVPKSVNGDASLVWDNVPNRGFLYLHSMFNEKLGVTLGKNLSPTEKRKILQVACSSMGFRGTPSLVIYKSSYPSDIPSSFVYFEISKCKGNEVSLNKCTWTYSGKGSPIQINCGYPSVKVQFSNVTNQSSVAAGSSSQFALNTNIKSCFVSKTEDNPWIEVRLLKSLFIHRMTAFLLNTSRQLVVTTYDNSRVITCNITMATEEEQKVTCNAYFETNKIKIALEGENLNLTLCRLDVFALESENQAHGILFDGWNGKPLSDADSILKFDQLFKKTPTEFDFISSFDLKNPPHGATFLSIKQYAYLMVKKSGSYLIGVACKSHCEVWLQRAEEPGLDDQGTPDGLIIKFESIESSTSAEKKYELSSTQNKNLQFSACHLYRIQIYAGLGGPLDQGYANMAVKLPGNADWTAPFPKELLYWTRPGSRNLKFTIINDVRRKIDLGSHLTIQALYRLCCDGMACPPCPVKLQLQAFDDTVLVNDSLQINCEEYNMTYETDLVVQPKNYTIQISYSLVGDIVFWQERRTIIDTIQVTVSIIYSCDFKSQPCKGWKVSKNSTMKYFRSSGKRSITKSKSIDSFLFPRPGRTSLESPLLPWTAAYKRISLCIQFSYLLSSVTASQLDVYSVTSAGQNLLWSVTGYQGGTWERARISVQMYEAFRILFKSNSKSNVTEITIKRFEVSTAECELYPAHAQPGFQCPTTKYQCANKRCTSKMYRCNNVKDGCIDGSDEAGCKCSTGSFTCSDGKCIDNSKLCDKTKDCKDGRDELHCGALCKGHLCFDGTCVTGSCSSRTCDDKTHLFSMCGYCSSRKTMNCTVQYQNNDIQCQTLQGTCGFENGPCGLQSDLNNTFRWEFYSPTSKHTQYPSFDHSMTNGGSYYILRHSTNKTGFSELTMKWSKTVIYCMQFWYVIPADSDSSLEVFVKTAKEKLSLLELKNSNSNTWSFAQLHVPGNSVGELIIAGYVTEHFVAIDDLSFIEGRCHKISTQDNPSCSFDDNKVCNMKVDSEWVVTTQILPNMNKQYHHEVSKDAYLTLSGSTSYPANISSPLIHPKTNGWRCLRFWLYSGNNYFNRKLDVLYITGNGSRVVMWSYSRVSDKWIFVQLQIPGEEDTLQVIFQGTKDNDAILSVDDVAFSKYQCHDIQDDRLGKECYNYKVLYSPERRTDKEKKGSSYSSDYNLGTQKWYRISRSAGNQVAQSCVEKPDSACSTIYKGWVNGTMPSVEEGQVERPMCFSSKVKGCCFPFDKVVKIRNCGEYFVYLFPKPSVAETKFCSVYKQVHLKLSITKEWERWNSSSYSIPLKWKILRNDEFQQVSNSLHDTRQNDERKSSAQDALLLLNGSAVSLNVKLKGYLKSLTMCLWLSVNNTSPLDLALSISNAPEKPWKKSFHLTRTNTSNSWKHFCFTWKSDFGVWQTFIDGVSTEHNIHLFDMKEMKNSILGISFDSKNRTLLKLTGLNVWDGVLTEHNILYQSYNCGHEKGNIVDWGEFHNKIPMVTTPKNSSILGFYPTTCNGRLGNALSLLTKTNTRISATAAVVSPRYERSSESPGVCLKFQYRLWGTGARALKLYQIMDDSQFPWRPIWMDDNNNSSVWREGRVTLSTVMAYRIVIEGVVTDDLGLLSIGALHTTEGYCPSSPGTASQACNEILTNSTGYVISPYYPGYYSSNASCTWSIKAKKHHVIRLEIKEFELEMSPQCEDDFIEVFDGDSPLAVSRIGRFCGVRYPPIIQSTSNNLFIVFKSNAANVRTGFMAYYQAIEDKQENSDCVQDCPADCTCARMTGPDQGIVISSTNLRSVPDRLPKESIAILFSGSQMFQLESENFYSLSRLLFIDLSFNKILQMEKKTFLRLPLLKAMRLNRNFIKVLEDETWVGLPKLSNLDIGENLLASVNGKVFSELKNMEVLSLRRNKITDLHVNAFENNTNLTYLYLDENEIEKIQSGIFRNQKKLKVLKLNDNKIQTFDKSTFRGLMSLEKLTLENNTIKESTIPQDVFEDLTNLKHLKLDSFILCCYAKEAIPGLICDSPGNSFSSCEDMLKNIVIRLGIWLQAIFASVGNLSVIIWWGILSKRTAGKQSGKANVQSFLLTNLAFADFLMGIYLLIIAIKDTMWKDVYFKHDVDWRSGITCQIAGGISTLSSEVSVMILVAMTSDRLNTIVFDFRAKRLNLKAVRILCISIWIIGFLISFLPLFLPSYFNDTTSGFSFYGRSTVCLPLQLSSEQPPGWEYSVAVFIVFNGVAIFFIFVAYLIIFIKVQRSAKQVRSTRGSSSSLGKRVVFVVLTDFCCWMPVIVLGVLSLAGVFKDPSGTVYAWIAVFVLPVNSSINPILYTFSSPQVKKKMRSIRTKKGPTAVTSQTMKTQGTTCVRENPYNIPLPAKFPSRSNLKKPPPQNGIHNSGHEFDSEDSALDTKL